MLTDNDVATFDGGDEARNDPTEMAQSLTDYALEQGSTDNISVIVVKLFTQNQPDEEDEGKEFGSHVATTSEGSSRGTSPFRSQEQSTASAGESESDGNKNSAA